MRITSTIAAVEACEVCRPMRARQVGGVLAPGQLPGVESASRQKGDLSVHRQAWGRLLGKALYRSCRRSHILIPDEGFTCCH